MAEIKPINIYLDDIVGPPILDYPEGYWTWVRTADEAIRLIQEGNVRWIDFDYNLGTAQTGHDVAQAIAELAEAGKIPPIKYSIHSGDVQGKQAIFEAMNRAKEFWR